MKEQRCNGVYKLETWTVLDSLGLKLIKRSHYVCSKCGNIKLDKREHPKLCNKKI